MTKDDIHKMILASLDGTLSEAHQRELDLWLQNPRNREYFDSVQRAVQTIQRRVEHYTPNQDRLKSQLAQRVADVNKVMVRRRVVRNALRYCAVVILVAAVSSFVAVSWTHTYIKNNSTSQPMQFSAIDGKSQITLDDGTKVWLNSGSDMTFTSGSDSRVAELNGEGYFEVAKDSERPFSVECNGLDVVVTGTKFNVESDGADRAIVSLLEGSVSLVTENVTEALTPQHYAVFDRSSGEIAINESEVESHKCWVNDELSFDNKSLSYICRYLSQWYGVKIVPDSKIESAYSFTFSMSDEPLEQILTMMADIHPLKYTSIGGGDVMITKVK